MRGTLAAFLRRGVAASEHRADFFPDDRAVLLVARDEVVLLAEVGETHRVEVHRQPQRRPLLDRMQHADGIAQVNQPEHLHRKIFDDEQLHVHRHRDADADTPAAVPSPRRHRAHFAVALQVRGRQHDAARFQLDRLR